MSTFVEDDPQLKQTLLTNNNKSTKIIPIQTYLNTLGQDLDIIIQVWV